MSPPPFAELLSRPSIAEATRATFGNIAIEEAEPLRGGLSAAALLKLTVGGRAYALRCSGQAPGSDPARELACMRIAAERGSPRRSSMRMSSRVFRSPNSSTGSP